MKAYTIRQIPGLIIVVGKTSLLGASNCGCLWQKNHEWNFKKVSF